MNDGERLPVEEPRQRDGVKLVYGVAVRGLAGRMIVGLIVAALGIVLLLDQLEIADASVVLRFWPALALAYGLMMLTGFCCRRHVTAGLLVSFFSGWLLLERLDVVHRSPWEFWPVVIVVLGASMVIAALRGPASAARLEEGASTVRAFAFWSGSTRKVVSEDFRGGEITAIMGGHEIDLRPAKIAGGTAVIDVFVWWGGVDLRVPADWRVSNETLALLGGVDDKTRAPEGEAKGHLVIKGLVVMGGVEVKN
jgi:predicted membrane protein